MIGYVQNSEQDTNTLWQRIQKKDQLPAKDRLYIEYGKDKFEGIDIDKDAEPELYDFIISSRDKIRFSNYTQEKLEYFAKRIYELRKN